MIETVINIVGVIAQVVLAIIALKFSIKVRNEDKINHTREIYKEFKEDVEPLLEHQPKALQEKLIEEYANNPKAFRFQPTYLECLSCIENFEQLLERCENREIKKEIIYEQLHKKDKALVSRINVFMQMNDLTPFALGFSKDNILKIQTDDLKEIINSHLQKESYDILNVKQSKYMRVRKYIANIKDIM